MYGFRKTFLADLACNSQQARWCYLAHSHGQITAQDMVSKQSHIMKLDMAKFFFACFKTAAQSDKVK